MSWGTYIKNMLIPEEMQVRLQLGKAALEREPDGCEEG